MRPSSKRCASPCAQSAASSGSTTITPELLTAAERPRYESYLRREEVNAAILELARDGVSIKQIVRRLGHSRNFIRKRCAAGEPMCSKLGNARLTRTTCSWTVSGAKAAATARSSGVASRRGASGARCVRLASGQPVDGGPKRSASSSYKGFFSQNYCPSHDDQTRLHDQD